MNLGHNPALWFLSIILLTGGAVLVAVLPVRGATMARGQLAGDAFDALAAVDDDEARTTGDGARSAATLLALLAASACVLAGFLCLLVTQHARTLGRRERGPFCRLLRREALAEPGATAKDARGLRRERCHIDEIVRESELRFEATARARGVRLVSRAGTGLVYADRERLLRVIASVVSNALSVTPAGGEVSLEGAADNSGAYFVVRDNGPGMAPDELAKLHIAKALIEMHDGALSVEREHGVGTKITVTLPRWDEPDA